MPSKIKSSKVLIPKVKPILKSGSLYYCETDRARTLIRLGKQIANEFSDLQGKKPIKYNLEYYRENTEFVTRVKEIIDGNNGLPFLLFLEKDNSVEEVS